MGSQGNNAAVIAVERRTGLQAGAAASPLSGPESLRYEGGEVLLRRLAMIEPTIMATSSASGPAHSPPVGPRARVLALEPSTVPRLSHAAATVRASRFGLGRRDSR